MNDKENQIELSLQQFKDRLNCTMLIYRKKKQVQVIQRLGCFAPLRNVCQRYQTKIRVLTDFPCQYVVRHLNSQALIRWRYLCWQNSLISLRLRLGISHMLPHTLSIDMIFTIFVETNKFCICILHISLSFGLGLMQRFVTMFSSQKCEQISWILFSNRLLA